MLHIKKMMGTALLGIVTPYIALTCTDFQLISKNKTVLITRTLEFSEPFESHIKTSTAGRMFQQKTPNGKPGLNWKATYGYIFLNGLGIDAVVDGMNEAGLSFEYLYLPNETEYPKITPGEESKAISYLNFGDWILSNFKSVEDVKTALQDIVVFEQKLPQLHGQVFPLHAAIHDASGNGIVVEFIQGKMQVHDFIGVMTNSPTYDWQVKNLENYVNLSPVNPKPIRTDGHTYSATGQGAGMFGLPGDPSPPSRFVKIAALVNTSQPPENDSDALNLAIHIINNVDIPKGFVRDSDKSFAGDYTQWTVFKDLTHGIFYYRTYENPALHAISVKKLNLTENAPRLDMAIEDGQQVIDMTGQFIAH